MPLLSTFSFSYLKARTAMFRNKRFQISFSVFFLMRLRAAAATSQSLKRRMQAFSASPSGHGKEAGGNGKFTGGGHKRRFLANAHDLPIALGAGMFFCAQYFLALAMLSTIAFLSVQAWSKNRSATVSVN